MTPFGDHIPVSLVESPGRSHVMAASVFHLHPGIARRRAARLKHHKLESCRLSFPHAKRLNHQKIDALGLSDVSTLASEEEVLAFRCLGACPHGVAESDMEHMQPSVTSPL